jgi:BirA family biotin operon repressor/biotin-[acetyl-CoA-carboxylase] ligase
MTLNISSSAQPDSIDQVNTDQSARFVQCLVETLDTSAVQACWLDRTDSTRFALQRVAPSSSAIRVVVAEQQQQGSGQAGRTWQSPRGNLYFSYAQALNTPLQGRLALEVAIALLAQPDFAHVPSLAVKWPNDLHHLSHGQSAKWGGILIEALPDQQVMIGVGINCMPMQDQVADQSVSDLATILGQSPDLMRLACQVATACQQAIVQFEQSSPQLAARFCQVDGLANHLIKVTQPQQELIGRADGIEADGALRLINSDGLHRIYSGQVRRYD